MSWECPQCGKSFRNTNQYHSCYITSLDDHLKNKPEEIILLFNKIHTYITGFGNIECNPVKSSIAYKCGANFVSLKIKKDRIEMDFQSAAGTSDKLIVKSVKISGTRYLHFAVLNNLKDFNSVIKNCILQSYKLVTGQTGGKK